MNVLLVGVRGHGGEEVYSSLLRDRPPQGVRVEATLDFHSSSATNRCSPLAEVLLNRFVHPYLRFNMGFRVLTVGCAVDLVHIHTHPTVLLGRTGRPVVFSAGSSHYHYVRDYEGWSEERIHRSYARARRVYRALGAVDALLNHEPVTLAYTFSEWARRIYLDHGVPEWKIRVLYPGFDIPPPEREDGPPVFLFLGRQPARKGGDAALAAFERVRQAVPQARMLYASDEPPANAVKGVEFLRLVPPDRVADLYSRANVFVNPTRAEGFGFTNVEAQGFGLPVISTNIAAIPEVVEDGVTGILVPPGNAASLIAAMRRLAESALLRHEMGAAARRRFERGFTLERFQAGLAELYRDAIDRASRFA